MRWLRVLFPGAVAALLLAGCGGGGGQGTTRAATTTAATTTAGTTTSATTTAATTTTVAASFRVTIEAATHTPKANTPWDVTIRAVDAAGKPVAAKLRMQVLFGGAVVGKIDEGRVYRFVGVWREKKGNEITWPPESVGHRLVFQAVVTAGGKTRKANWWIQVRK